MRSIVLCHFCFRKREMDRIKSLIEKKKIDAIKKYDNINNMFKLNEECEQKLVSVSNQDIFDNMTV